MTKEEIKSNVTMTEVLSRYGIKVRNNMCSCPWHTDRHPSMKVFKDGANCFACGWNGDIFTFIMKMEGCSFKDAFISLGGTYSQYDDDTERKIMMAKYNRGKRERENKAKSEEEFKTLLTRSIKLCRDLITDKEPFSDVWCEAHEILPKLIGAWEEYTEQREIKKIDVIRMCKRIESFRNSL